MLAFAQDTQCQIRESMALCACGRSHAASFEWLSTCHLNALGSEPHDFNVSWLHVGAAAAAAVATRQVCANSSARCWGHLGKADDAVPRAGTPLAPRGGNRSCFQHFYTFLILRLKFRIAACIFIFLITGNTSNRLMVWKQVWESKGMLESIRWTLGRELISFLCFIDTVACDATLGCDKSRG